MKFFSSSMILLEICQLFATPSLYVCTSWPCDLAPPLWSEMPEFAGMNRATRSWAQQQLSNPITTLCPLHSSYTLGSNPDLVVAMSKNCSRLFVGSSSSFLPQESLTGPELLSFLCFFFFSTICQRFIFYKKGFMTYMGHVPLAFKPLYNIRYSTVDWNWNRHCSYVEKNMSSRFLELHLY